MSSINNYMKSIAKFLVLNKEKIYSIGELYSELDKNYPEYYLRREENLKQFKLAIFNIDEEYENIHKFLINNVYNIIYSLKTKTDIINIYSKRTYSSYIREPELNYIDIIENYIYNGRYKYLITTDNYIDGENTGLHLLIKNNNKLLLRRLISNINVDWGIRTSTGKSCLELAKKDNNVDIVELILNDKLTKERNEYASEMEKKNNEISKIRKSQNQLQEGYMVFHFVTSVLIFLVLLPNLFENAVIVTLLNSIQIFVNLVLFDSRRERSEVLIDKKYQ